MPMPLYFFHFHQNQALVEDEEGLELPDLDAAKSEAITSIHDLIGETKLTGARFDKDGYIEIADASGQVLAVIRFADCIGNGTA